MKIITKTSHELVNKLKMDHIAYIRQYAHKIPNPENMLPCFAKKLSCKAAYLNTNFFKIYLV